MRAQNLRTQPRFWRTRARKASIAVVLCSLALTGCTAQGLDSQSATGTGRPVETAQARADGTKILNFPVYWLGKSGDSTRLFREYVDSEPAADPIAQAIDFMLSQSPTDPDFFTPWKPGAALSVSTSTDGVITVDLPSDVFSSGIDQTTADLAVQQLVYTATAAAANAGILPAGNTGTVIVLVDGKAGYRAFGRTDLGEPMSREVKAIAPIWIIEPQEQAVRSGSPLDIFISSTSVDPIRWELRALDSGPLPQDAAERMRKILGGDTTTSGTVTPEDNGSGSFITKFSLDVEPGNYALIAYRGADGASDAAQIDTKILRIDSTK